MSFRRGISRHGLYIGALWRLNEIGILGSLKRVSSVSGGSIAAGVLGMNWKALGVSLQNPTAPKDKFIQFVVTPLRQLASTTIDEGAIFGGIFLPGSIADHVAAKYDELLFEGRTLQDLPDDNEGPSLCYQRDECPIRRTHAFLQALHARLPGRSGAQA